MWRKWVSVWAVLAVASLGWAMNSSGPSSSAAPRTLLAFWNFEDGPQGWTAIDGNGDGQTWTVGTTSDIGSYTPPDYGTQYAYYSDDDAGYGAGAGDEIWYSPSTNISGETALYLIFSYGVRVINAAETLACYVVFNTTSTPETTMVWVYTGTSDDESGSDTVDLSGYLPKDDIVVYFRYVDPNNGWYWAVGVDNVTLTTSVAADHDVAVIDILTPGTGVPANSVITPQAKVKNLGTNTETFDVNFVIVDTFAAPWDTLYEDIQTVSNLAPNDTVIVSFTSWTTPHTHGVTYLTVARTLLSTDENPANDAYVSYTTTYSTSGSDAYGWQWADSDDPAGPTYNWLDIWGNTAGADSVDTLALGDDGEAKIALYNAIQLYGGVYDSMVVGSNGGVEFIKTYVSYINEALPSSNQGRFFAVFWDDLRCANSVSANNPDGDSLVYVGYFSDTLLVIEWHNVPRYASSRYFTFELLIYTPRGGTNRFVYQYKDMSAYNPNSDDATIGMQDTLGSGNYVLYTYDENPITPNWAERAGHAIEFVNPDPVLVAEQSTIQPPLRFAVTPNVVQHRATLQFSLPALSDVSVDLYDLAGRHVQTLAHGTFSEGTHTLQANLNHLASGVYFVVLKTNHTTRTQRIVLVR